MLIRRCLTCSKDITGNWARNEAWEHRRRGHRVVWVDTETGEEFEQYPRRRAMEPVEPQVGAQGQQEEEVKVITPTPTTKVTQPLVGSRVGYGIYRVTLRGLNWDFTEDMFDEFASAYNIFKRYFDYNKTPGEFIRQCVDLTKRMAIAFADLGEEELKEILR